MANASSEHVCPPGMFPVVQKPNIIFTNGSANFENKIGNFTCVDADQETFVVVCENKTSIDNLSSDPRKECQSNGQVCLPKCCLFDEVFNVEKMTCAKVILIIYKMQYKLPLKCQPSILRKVNHIPSLNQGKSIS